MSQRFLNGMLAAKAQMAVSIIADLQSTNTEAMIELEPKYRSTLKEATAALSAIANDLRMRDHDKEDR